MDSTAQQDIEAFYAPYPKRSYDKGQILIYSGDKVSSVYLLEKGLIRQYDVTKDGKEVVVNIFKAPAVVPVCRVMNKTPSSYFFDASTNVVVRAAPIETFIDFVKGNSIVMYELLNRVYRGMEGILRKSAYLMSGDTNGRLLYELVHECRRFDGGQPDGAYHLHVNEADIAKRTGLSRETISRHLQTLGNKRVIEAKHDGIIVKDFHELELLLNDTVF